MVKAARVYVNNHVRTFELASDWYRSIGRNKRLKRLLVSRDRRLINTVYVMSRRNIVVIQTYWDLFFSASSAEITHLLFWTRSGATWLQSWRSLAHHPRQRQIPVSTYSSCPIIPFVPELKFPILTSETCFIRYRINICGFKKICWFVNKLRRL